MNRSGGILLHITSLPGIEGIGTLGKNAYQFIDLLAESGQKLWQILPLGPTGYGNSPYMCYSAFAGNPLLIDLSFLIKEGLLSDSDLKPIPTFNLQKIEFSNVEKWKYPVLLRAFKNFKNNHFPDFENQYTQFLNEHNWWLNDYALFMSIKEHFNDTIWTCWEGTIKFRTTDAMNKYGNELQVKIAFWKFVQFLFFTQWFRLKKYANSKNIKIIGDAPLYVSGNSSDVWSNPDIFLLDNQLNPTQVGGVPPDYFSEDGQLWGNPVYNWQRLSERDYDWWIARLHFNLKLYDLVRIDHFRGLESFWSVDAGSATAKTGKWEPAFGFNLLAKLQEQIGELPVIAEDLGLITQAVKKLRDDYNLPGMKVLQFAFSSDSGNEYLPHNYSHNFVAYTGTHDNETTRGWYQSAKKQEKQTIKKYFHGKNRHISNWAVEQVWASVANKAIAPLQDILSLGSSGRMNIPGTATNNWGWRFTEKSIKPKHITFLKEITEKYRR